MCFSSQVTFYLYSESFIVIEQENNDLVKQTNRSDDGNAQLHKLVIMVYGQTTVQKFSVSKIFFYY